MNNKHTFERKSELISDLVAQVKSQTSTLVSGLGKVGNYLIYNCTREQEPQIWEKRSRTGQIWYHAYDPRTGRSAHCSDENDVRAWLDRLPY